MHVLESYALQNDLKIDKPYTYEKFFPMVVDKFITIDTSNLGTEALSYDHWQHVVNLIYPYLKEKEIAIVNLGDKDSIPLTNCYSAVGQCNFNQKAYVIKKSMVHASTNNESCHLASAFNKKSVTLFPHNCFPEQFFPYWTEKDNSVILKSSKVTKKPSFNPSEKPKSINTIKPEEVAKNILNFLGIFSFVPQFETLTIGTAFNRKRIESNLTHLVDCEKLGAASLIVRMDLNFNEDALEKQLQVCPCSVITNRPISNNILEKYNKRIIELVYYLEDDNDPDFIRRVKEKSINYIMRSRHGGEKLKDFKLAYLDYGLVHYIKPKTKNDFPELKDKNNIYYKSNFFIVHNQKFYPCSSALINNIHGAPTMQYQPSEIIDDPLFWEEAEHFHFFKKK